MQSITLIQPDDWHCHLRDDAYLARTVADTALQFKRAIVMPNLRPPVTTVELAAAYRERILAALPAGSTFEPLMTLYITDQMSPAEIVKASASGFVKAVKLYPAGATTNSDSGVTSFDKVMGTLEKMAEVGLPLLVHGEVTRAEIDVFDREKAFIDEHLTRVVERFPTLKVVFEHITTRDAVQFVEAASANVGATITAHHLLYNRNHMLVGGIRPHFYCLPILKRNVHQEALLDAATSGNANDSTSRHFTAVRSVIVAHPGVEPRPPPFSPSRPAMSMRKPLWRRRPRRISLGRSPTYESGPTPGVNERSACAESPSARRTHCSIDQSPH